MLLSLLFTVVSSAVVQVSGNNPRMRAPREARAMDPGTCVHRGISFLSRARFMRCSPLVRTRAVPESRANKLRAADVADLLRNAGIAVHLLLRELPARIL